MQEWRQSCAIGREGRRGFRTYSGRRTSSIIAFAARKKLKKNGSTSGAIRLWKDFAPVKTIGPGGGAVPSGKVECLEPNALVCVRANRSVLRSSRSTFCNSHAQSLSQDIVCQLRVGFAGGKIHHAPCAPSCPAFLSHLSRADGFDKRTGPMEVIRTGVMPQNSNVHCFRARWLGAW